MYDIVEFCGSYSYANEQALDAAVLAARDKLSIELVTAWADCFTREDATLHVHALLPDHVSDAFTESVLHKLATTAVQGAIEARRAGRTEEYYFVESLNSRD